MITIPVQRPWHLKTPTLVRYMARGYVQEFFEKGILRLSCFAEFAKHRDEQRLDPNEGRNMIVGRTEDQTVLGWSKHGSNSYVLCTTQIESAELQAAFGCDHGFRIKDSTAFGMTIASALPRFQEGIEGPCIYQDKHMIERQLNSFEAEKLKGQQVSRENAVALVSQIGGVDVFFVKDRKYSSQAEYRFIWNVGQDVVGPLDIHCPDARQFCEPLS